MDVILSDGSVFRFDGDSGSWRHIPDVATANAMGVDWGNLDAEDSLPGPQGDDWPSVQGGGGGGGGGGSSSSGDGQPTIDGRPELVGLPDGTVWLLDNGIYRHIPDPQTLTAIGFQWSQITWQDSLPGSTGPDVPPLTSPAPVAGPAPPPPPPTQEQALELGDYGGELSDDQVMFGIFQASSSDVPSPATVLPAQAWADLRTTLVSDLPFVGHHVRNQGARLKGVLASDLWSSST